MNITTYNRAYGTEVSLCDACVERDDHGCGTLTDVSEGEHVGQCEGERHRDIDGVMLRRDGYVWYAYCSEQHGGNCRISPSHRHYYQCVGCGAAYHASVILAAQAKRREQHVKS